MKQTATAEDYHRIFEAEQVNEYPEVDAFERSCGFAVNRTQLEYAARVLACPLKVNPPVWQHGRVLYSATRRRLQGETAPGVLLDIGTAKGFSAVILAWAARDAQWPGEVHSVDIVDPAARVRRNSVREAGGDLFTAHEFIEPFQPEGVPVHLHGGGSMALLHKFTGPLTLPVAFVDGKHDRHAVAQEGRAIRELQARGDIIVFDDLQITPVALAVRDLGGYRLEYVRAGFRHYAIATRL